MLNSKKSEKLHKNQKGVALAGAAIAMTIALGLVVGLVVSVISTQSDISDTDTSQRVLAAAEGGAESFLSLDSRQLERWVGDVGSHRTTICDDDLNGDLDGDTCVFTFTPTENDDIEAQATVSVESFNSSHGNRGEVVKKQINPGDVREFILEGYNQELSVCWDDQDGEVGLYVIANNSEANPASKLFSKLLIRCNDANCPNWQVASSLPSPPPIVDAEAPTPQDEEDGFSGYSCYHDLKDIIDDVRGPAVTSETRLRVYAVPGGGVSTDSTTVGLIAENGNRFPDQGFKITSIGKLTSPSPIQIEKRVVVYRSHPYLPSLFDFALYAEGLADVAERN